MNAQRFSKVIQSRESKRVSNYLLEVYHCLTPSQRKIIREDMERIKSNKKEL